MKGDYHRYRAEFKSGDERKATAEDTMLAYKEAQLLNDTRWLYAEYAQRPSRCRVFEQTLSQVTHLSLVRYYGYLVHNDDKLLIVEYVANGTLRDHLDCKEGMILDMATRLDIATDVAHAITYLHMYTQPPIIHKDIKSSNILLAENFRAKVADFGFARLAPDTESGATHVQQHDSLVS